MSFKENRADLGNGEYLVWLGSEPVKVALGVEVKQVAWAAGLHITTCASPDRWISFG